MQAVWSAFHTLFIPSQKNAYRPRVLRRSWLLFFLAVMLGAEGFLMTNLMGTQSNEVFLASVAGSTPMVANAPGSLHFFQTLAQQFVRVAGDPQVDNAVVAAVGALLTLAVLFAFVIHIQIQPKEMLGGGLVLAMLAFLFLYANTRVLVASSGGGAQTADAAASVVGR